jgi:hypothetical protein
MYYNFNTYHKNNDYIINYSEIIQNSNKKYLKNLLENHKNEELIKKNVEKSNYKKIIENTIKSYLDDNKCLIDNKNSNDNIHKKLNKNYSFELGVYIPISIGILVFSFILLKR